MCTPVALGVLSFAVQGAQAVAGYMAQSQEAKATKAAAEQAWRDDQEQITQRHMQEEDALRQKQRMQDIEEAKAKAETVTSGAAAGVSGISLDNLLRDVGRRAATNRDVEETNTAMILSQLRLQRKGATSRAVSRINSAPAPSPLSLVAGLGSAGISGFNSFVSRKNNLM